MRWLKRLMERRYREDELAYLRIRLANPFLSADRRVELELEYIVLEDGITLEEPRKLWGPVHMEPLRHEEVNGDG